MMNQHLRSLLVASSLSLAVLAGCQAPMAVTAGASANGESGSESAAAMSEERSMDDHATIAAQEEATTSAYRIQQIAATTAVGAALTLPAISIPADIRAKVEARMAARAATIKTRLDKLGEQRAKIRAALTSLALVDNGNGTSNKTLEVNVAATANAKAEKKAKLVRIVKTDTKETLGWHTEFSRTNPSGLTRTSSRDKTLNADGSYTVVFHTMLTLPNGRSRMADWTKTIAADGNVTGTGTIIWKDKAGTVTKTSAITLGGDEDKPTSKTTDSGATASLPIDGQASIKTDDGQSKTLDADSETLDAQASVDASASANANGSATANTSASANAAK